MFSVSGKDTKNDTRFTCHIAEDLAFEIIQMFELGCDPIAEELLDANLDHVQRQVVDAMSWVDFDVIYLITRGTRFAIKHNDIEFGVGRNLYQAKLALIHEEF